MLQTIAHVTAVALGIAIKIISMHLFALFKNAALVTLHLSSQI